MYTRTQVIHHDALIKSFPYPKGLVIFVLKFVSYRKDLEGWNFEVDLERSFNLACILRRGGGPASCLEAPPMGDLMCM